MSLGHLFMSDSKKMQKVIEFSLKGSNPQVWAKINNESNGLLAHWIK